MATADVVNAIEVDAHDPESDSLCEFALFADQPARFDLPDICRWEDEGGAIGRSEADGD
jgi:hypothetical protein